jgi:hypothetical protein
MGFFVQSSKEVGFSITWIKWVSTFYWTAFSKIKVNDKIGNPFHFARFVCQGCPFASYLFILTMNVFGHALSNPCYNVKGFTLPKGGVFQDQTFTNNATFYLHGSPTNLNNMK